MFEPQPIIRPAIKDDVPDGKYPVWFFLNEVDGTHSSKSGLSKGTSWFKNHAVVSNSDNSLVVPLIITRPEYKAFFSQDAKQKPKEGLETFLRERYEKQQPEAIPFHEAKKSCLQLGAHYSAIGPQGGVNTQYYLPGEGHGDKFQGY